MGGKADAAAEAASLRRVALLDELANAQFCSNVVFTSKYTLLNFVPKNLYEQFRRFANIYFAVISGLQLIPGLSPTGRFTTLIPLVLVLTFSAIKEAVEDLARHRADRKVNARQVLALRSGVWVAVEWADVRHGDVLRVRSGEFLPADVVLLASSEAQGIAYIETASLDGETNLKIRQALDETSAALGGDEGDAAVVERAVRGWTICSEQPNKRLYNFDASLERGGGDEALSLAPKQLLLRGAQLRNTEWAIGAVVFAGRDTKLVRNSAKVPLKRSNVERQANKQILLLFALELTLAIVCAIGFSVWQGANEDAWYLAFDEAGSRGQTGFLAFLTFVILYNTIVPISLYVSLEMCKLGQAYLINHDLNMYYEKNDTPAVARTSNLNEELGQVEYIFSDKTGTLTRNQMQFRQCTVGGTAFGDMSEGYTGPAFVDSDAAEAALADPFVQFTDERLDARIHDKQERVAVEYVTLLAVCHTVIPERQDDGTIRYEAASPDEAALVAAAKHLGYRFVDRTMKSVTVERRDGKKLVYELLNVLEFNSTRKRMSVIVRMPDKRIVLYCKGADTVIYERLRKGEPTRDTTLAHLERFAATGLRTLCCGMVELDATEYKEWNKTFHAASVALSDRNAKLDAAAAAIEKNLELLGTTAIEDKLQVGVPATIATLARAGVNIWVLTGDKQETAINIAYSCRLFTKKMHVVVLNAYTHDDCSDEIERLLEAHPARDERLALVIDGGSLEHALAPSLEKRFLELGVRCKAVVACRVSPAQKAEVVKLVRNNVGAITLAIGDGANDVSMIQAAHVGIGISGEEGLQAARAADYAIAQFRFLQPLMLVHGRLAYRRVAKLINYSFYKNIVLVLTQFWFTLFNGFSGQSFYEQWTLASFNAIFTAFPIIFYGILDRDVSDASANRFPALYKLGQKSYYYSVRVFAGWMANGVIHASVLFLLPLGATTALVTPSGRAIGVFEAGLVVYTAAIIVVTAKLGLESHYWVWLNHLFNWGSVLILWFGFQLFYSLFGLAEYVFIGWDITFSFYIIASTAAYWFTVLLTVFVALSRDVIWAYYKRTYRPEAHHIVQEIEKLERETGEVLYVDEAAAAESDDDEGEEMGSAGAADDNDAAKLKKKKKKKKKAKEPLLNSRSPLIPAGQGGDEASLASADTSDDEAMTTSGVLSSGALNAHRGYAFSQSAAQAAHLKEYYKKYGRGGGEGGGSKKKRKQKKKKQAKAESGEEDEDDESDSDRYVSLGSNALSDAELQKRAEQRAERHARRRKRRQDLAPEDDDLEGSYEVSDDDFED